MEAYIAKNVSNMTFNVSTYFERCNVIGCTFNAECNFDRCNIINCINTNNCVCVKSNIVNNKSDDKSITDNIVVDSTEVI